MKIGRVVAIGLGGFLGAAAGGLSMRFYLGRRRAERIWAAARYPKLGNVGTVKRLAILPLIDWYTVDKGLVGEPGVAYLIRADDTTILFDTGYNEHGEHPSPLLRNMEALGIDVAEIDALVISHAHEDHVGGMAHMMQHTFALSGRPVDLRGIPAYVPVPLSHPTAQAVVVREPRVIARGVASMGTIPRQLFFLGCVLEQSLAVNVEKKGVVLIIGCGHPGLQRIIDRAEMLFDEPLYGLVGGLHYPITASRAIKFGVHLQRFLGTGKWPWKPITPGEVQQAIAYLQRRHPRLVALSAHDSCDWSIETFRQAFGGAYEDLLVGKELVIQ